MSDGETKPKSGLRPPWKPGEVANPAGRPRGSRNRLSERFFKDLYAAWEEKGVFAIEEMIKRSPGDFVKVVASQMPKEFLVGSSGLSDVSDEDLVEFIATLRQLSGSGNPPKSRNGTRKTTH